MKIKTNVFSMTFRSAPFLTIFYIILTVCSALMSTVVLTYATAYFVDFALNILNTDSNKDKIYFPLGIMLFVMLFTNIITPIMNLVKKRLLLTLKGKYKPFLIKKQAELEYYYIEDKEIFELISRVTNNMEERLINGFSSIMTIFTMVIYIISVLGMIISYVWWAAILIMLFSAPMLKLSILSGRKSYQATCETEKFQRQIEYLENILTERDYNEERTLFSYCDSIGDKWWSIYNKGCRLRINVQARYMALTKSSTMELSLIAIFVAIALLSSVIDGTISPGVYMGIIGTVISITHQMGWDMSAAVETIANTGEFIKEYNEFIDLKSNSEYLSTPYPYAIHIESIEFKNVSFKYPNSDDYVLKDISFKLQKGRHYAFVGSNGAGKTTITKLLMGLYCDYEGEILINNIEAKDFSKDVLKAMFSSIHQDFAKYEISLKDNILIGNVARECNDDSLKEAMESANLGEIVKKMDGNIDKPLGKIKEDGTELSMGQWQKVAIARAIMSDSPVKIFDEPTSSLDPISESNIYNEFEKLMKGKMTIFISHRLGSTKISDEILVLDSGRIEEQGTHDELMALKGKYYEMFESQRRWYQ